VTYSPPPSGPVVVDLYARLSRNPLGELEKIDTQLEDCRRVVERMGWTVGAEHVDNSLSAWRRDVRRPGWEALLARLESGATSGVVVYHQDRLMRQPRDLERLIELADSRNLKLATAHGTRDLADPDQRFIARVEVAHAVRSSDDTSRRARRRFAAMRQNGVVRGGPRSFGFPGGDLAAPPDENGKRPPVPAELVQREREAIREASEAVAYRGGKLAVIAAEWNDAGLRTATGGTWDGVNVRQVLTRPRNAGLIEHEGTIVGRVKDEDPILDERLWDDLQVVFAGRRRGRAPDTRNYIATGLIHCGHCGRSLTGRPRARYRPDGTQVTEYYCHKPRGGCGRLCVDARYVDEVLRQFAIRRLSDARFAKQLASAAAQLGHRLEEVEAELEAARQAEEALSAKMGRGEISLSAWEVGHKHAHARVVELQSKRDELAQQQAAEDDDASFKAARAEELAADWAADEQASGTQRRAMLVRALRGRHVVIEPRPHQKGRPVFDVRRVRILPAGSASDNGPA
jgi:site-specific DNA recombinase